MMTHEPATPIRQAIALLAIVLMIGAGACLFDAGEHPGEDLCFALVAVTAVPVLLFIMMRAGELAPASVLTVPRLRLDFPAPPPRI